MTGDMAGRRIGGRDMGRQTGVVTADRRDGERKGLRSSTNGLAIGLRAIAKDGRPQFGAEDGV
jgi:hypothetical protein